MTMIVDVESSGGGESGRTSTSGDRTPPRSPWKGSAGRPTKTRTCGQWIEARLACCSPRLHIWAMVAWAIFLASCMAVGLTLVWTRAWPDSEDSPSSGAPGAGGAEAGSSSALSLIKLPDGGGRAVCNDGSPGGYYFRASSSAEWANTWLLFLPGGGQCYDQSSCSSRWSSSPDLMSSSAWDHTRQGEGILAGQASATPLWGANKAMLGYCSSDGYMGDASASDQTWGWHFRGQALLRAMIHDLTLHHGLGNATLIVLGGSSAGGRGVMTNLDDLIETVFPRTAAVVGFIDSPLYMDVTPLNPSFRGFQYQEQQKARLYNTSALTRSCLLDNAEQPGSSSGLQDQWRCQYGQYRMPAVRAPYFLIASQSDSYQLAANTGLTPDQYQSNPRAQAWAARFGTLTQQVMRNLSLPEAAAGSGSGTTPWGSGTRSGGPLGLFSPTCYTHAVAPSAAFHAGAAAGTAAGVSQRDALAAFLALLPAMPGAAAAPPPPPSGLQVLTWIDECVGFNCGRNC